MRINSIIKGDALQGLKKLADKSVNMCMTSPPYWALRDYGIEGQLGLEPTFDEYITDLCNIFDEVKRVLRDDGTCWINLGDTYGGKEKKNDYMSPKYKKNLNNSFKRPNGKINSKCLMGIPFRFAIEMMSRGWILRNTIIWQKPNCMPSSVKDRFTVDFEYLFFFSKKKQYYFEKQYEPYENPKDTLYRKKIRAGKEYNTKQPYQENTPYIRDFKTKKDSKVRGIPQHHGSDISYDEKGRNKRAVWPISTTKFPDAHFAVYPEELCEIPLKAGCPEKGIVLDPFFGAGTTGLVALKQGKKFIGVELNPEYVEIAEKRLKPYLEQTRL